MKKYSYIAIIFISLLFLQACSSKLMTPKLNTKNDVLNKNTAYITFFRPASMSGMVQAPIIEYTNGNMKFVGILSNDYKIRYKVTPGEHIFVVGGESCSPMVANVSGNKAYYVLVKPGLGFMKTRFYLDGLSQQEIKENILDIRKCILVEITPDAKEWYAEHKSSLRSKGKKGLEDLKDPETKKKVTLHPYDGIDKLL